MEKCGNRLSKRFMCFLLMLALVFSSCAVFTGGVKADNTGADGTNLQETGSYIGDRTDAKVYDDFENDIWLQYQQKSLSVGDTVDLRPWRVEQIIGDPINNDVQRPEFHFEIIQGDSISLDTTESTEKAVVTADKAGTSIVKVTYDALTYKGQTWGAISPVNTCYAVYTVGETGKATITTNDAFANWRHYDTIYYDQGETVPYAFTVDTTDAVTTEVTVNGIKINGDGDKYTANLENRSNIIGIKATDADGNVKSIYRIIDARFIEINIANKTNPGQPFKAGDTANVSFRGITMPVYKLATIYNPQFGSSRYGTKATRVVYHNDTLGDCEGICSQWDLADNNDFDVTLTDSGNYTFTGKGIASEWWGSTLGADLTAAGPGEPNLSAPTCAGVFSTLPDFDITAGDSVSVSSITLDKTDMTLDQGENAQLSATVTPDNATHKTVTWSCSDEAVATVDDTGNVTAVAAGTAEIKASADGQEAVCTVNVNNVVKPVTGITVTPESLALSVGQSQTVAAQLTPADATDQTVTWSSTDPSVASVDQGGKITAVAAGTATVEAKAGDQTAVCTVTVVKGEDEFAFVVSTDGNKIHPGSKVTVRFPNLQVPDTGDEIVHTMQTFYTTDIPGLEKVSSEEAGNQEDEIRTITFTVPEDTPYGTYHLTDGYVFKEYGGFRVQGVFWVNKTSQNFYEGEMPEITFTVSDPELDAYKDNSKAILDSYKNPADYRDEQKQELAAAVEAGKAAIDGAATQDEVDTALAEAKAKLDAIKTDAQLKEEEKQPAAPVEPSGDNGNNGSSGNTATDSSTGSASGTVSGNAASTAGSNVGTGVQDDTAASIWTLAVLIAAAGLGGTFIIRKRKHS